MCPLCIGAATWYLAGASSAGGTAMIVKRSIQQRKNKMKPKRPVGGASQNLNTTPTLASPCTITLPE